MYKVQCTDVVHESMGRSFTQYNKMGDLFIFANLGLLILSICGHWILRPLVCNALMAALVLTCLRGLVAWTTQCKCDANTDNATMTSRPNNNVWFIISSHTMVSLMITSVLWFSPQVPLVVKYASVVCSALVALFQAATREHYSIDILICCVLVYLVMVLFAFP